MTWLYFIILVFSALTLYFVYGDYKKERFSKRHLPLSALWRQFRQNYCCCSADYIVLNKKRRYEHEEDY